MPVSALERKVQTPTKQDAIAGPAISELRNTKVVGGLDDGVT
jgi:hypothetical protein